MRAVIISQARMGSTRLPGKVLHQAAGKTFLQHQLDRLRKVRFASDVWVATTEKSQDEPIVELCKSLGVPCYRGSEDDVLSRYHGAALAAGAEMVVRVTSDCPLIDPTVIDRIINRILTDSAKPDYVSNTLTRSYPRGLDCEVFTMSALDEAHGKAVRKEEREHVTPYIYWRPEHFRIVQEIFSTDLSMHRWTIDTIEDEELVRRLLEAAVNISDDFTLIDLLQVIEKNPDWPKINAGTEQKAIYK